MNAKTDSFPTFRRFFRFVGRCLRRLCRIFLSRRSAVVYISVVTLGWLALTIERWQGRRAWAAEKERLAAAGDTFEITHLLTLRPPDAENFLAIPEFKELGSSHLITGEDNPLELWLARRYVIVTDKQGRPVLSRRGLPYRKPPGYHIDELTGSLADLCTFFRKTGMLAPEPLDPNPAKELLLSAQQKWGPLLEALYNASARPSAVVLPSPAERMAKGEVPQMNGKAMALMRSARAIAVHARAAVETGDGALAEKDLRILAKFEEALYNEGGFIDVLRVRTVRLAQLEVLRQGLVKHLWTTAQLDIVAAGSDPAVVWPRIRTALAIDRYADCYRWMNSNPRDLQYITSDKDSAKLWQKIRFIYMRTFPEGPLMRICADTSRQYSRCLAGIPVTGIPAEGWPALMKKLEAAEKQEPNVVGGFLRHRYLLSPWSDRRFVFILCALERHFLAHSRYPAALADLSPPLPAEFLPDTDEQPLRYRTSANGTTFRLWSVGWDGKENNGAKTDDDMVVSTE